MNDELENLTNEINDFKPIEVDKITVELIENSGTKQSKLIFNEDPNFSIKLENREYKFKFVEPLYIDRIVIKAKTIFKGLNIIYKTNDSDKRYVIQSDKNNSLSVNLKDIVYEIIIQNPKDKKIELEKIELFGFRLSELESIKNNFGELKKLDIELKNEVKKITETNQAQLDEIKNKSLALEQLHEKLDDDIESLKIQKEELEKETEDLNSQITKLSETKNNLENTKTDLTKKEQELKNSIQEREATLTTINTNISAKREELKKLESDTSLIAYDVQGYIKTANTHLLWYLGLSIIPWFLIVFMSYIIVFGGIDLITVLKVELDAQLWTIFWSRIPFVFAVGTVIFVAYEVSNIFIRKIMEINQQKLDFQKLGILSKDVSESACEGLDLNDEQKFELRTKLKMDMLKSHLSKDLGKNFEIDIKPKIWNKYLNRNNKDTKPINNEDTQQENNDSKNE
ncbi:coiled-coil domain-containing protein [Aliarcobacter butzleri]|uniref:coiled-coil domain-containing protein n=1 Tax=Aliarcobacter butzleri TaxID=28197 RepID=UPI003AF8F314